MRSTTPIRGSGTWKAGRRAALLLCFLLIQIPGGILADVIHPAYLNMREIEPGIFDVVWKVPLRYGMRLPVEPVFPSHSKAVTDRTVETFPNALIERWRIACGSGGLDGETIEVAGLAVTLIDAFVQIELLDGRIYDGLLRGASPKFTVEPRRPALRILRENFSFGLRNIIRKLPVILLILAVVIYFGNTWTMLAALAAFAAGYTLSLFGIAFSWIGMASGWGSAAVGISAMSLALGSLKAHDKGRSFLSAALLLTGILYGAALGGEWGGQGLAYLDIPFAAAAILAGAFTGLVLIAGLPVLAGLVIRDLGKDRIKSLRNVPTYIAGTLAVFLFLQSVRGLIPPGIVQPYVRPESMILALTGGFWLSVIDKKKGILYAACFLALAIAGALLGTGGVDLPVSSVVIPLSIAILGIAMLFASRGRSYAGISFSCAAGLYHGWLGSNWLLEHVNTMLPSAVGGLVLFAGIMITGKLLGKSLTSVSAVRLGRTGGLALLVWAFWMRLSGYTVSEFREISVSTAGGIYIPILSLIILAAALIAIRRLKKKSVLPAAVLLVLSLILMPVGGFTLGGGPSSLADMSDEEAAVLIGGLLENTYRAVNLRGEDEIYDRLAMSVDGDLVETIYLESRKQSVMPGRADTEAKLIGVQILEVSGRSPVPDGSGYSFTTVWTVTGTVRHWAHKHNRLNRYNGIITVKAIDDLWKISGLELLDETRI